MKRNSANMYISMAILFAVNSSCKVRQHTDSRSGDLEIGAPTVQMDQVRMGGRTVKAEHQVVIYRTKRDYSKYVPVILSKDKSRIVSYPDVSDVYLNGKLAYPTKLDDGYLLDNRGINEDVAFTGYTYSEYAKLKTTPSVEQLFKCIVDDSPLLCMVYCGSQSKYPNGVADLNRLIKDGFQGLTMLNFVQ